MIDIHSHILPWLDDGAADLNETLEMARIAVSDGVTAIVATPHCNLPGLYQNYCGEAYWEIFWRTAQALKDADIPLTLYPGMEVFVTPDLPERIARGQILTLNRSRYLLVEFAFDEDPDYAKHMLAKLDACGVRPVIAHAERYDFIQNEPAFAYDFQTNGYLIQINKGSLLGRFGTDIQRTAHRLLRHGIVSVIASDAHSSHLRTPRMKEMRNALEMQYAKEYTAVLFHENPKRICSDQATYRFKAKPFHN